MTINKKYINLFIKSTEVAAYGASLFVGKGDKIGADQAAVDRMRNQLNCIDMKGRIVIGEGELDDAPMLYIGEKVGNGTGENLDIAVDPVEGTNFVSKNLPNAISVLAAAKRGDMLHAPETYMEKIAIGPGYEKNLIDLDLGVKKNIERISESKNISPDKLTACILKRPRHEKIADILNEMNVKIQYISDGDVFGALSVAYKNLNIDLYLGIGGGPEGVLAAAALKCLNCQMQTRLTFQNEEEIDRTKKLGITDLKRKYYIEEMIKGDVIFSATGITDGQLLTGIKDHGNFFEAETFILHYNSKTNKKVKNKLKK